MKNLVLTLAFLPLFARAQEAPTEEKKEEKKFAFGISASADRCFRIMYSNPKTGKFGVCHYSDEKPIFGFTAGADFQWQIAKRWHLDAGLLYAKKGFKTKPFEFTHIIVIDPNDPAIPKKAQTFYHFSYMDIPMRVQYHFTTGKWQFYGIAGVSTNIFLSETTVSRREYADGKELVSKTNDNSNFARLNLAATGGLGLRLNLKNAFIKMEAVYRTSVTSFTNTDTHYYFNQAGIDIGYYWRF
ncbi:MAG TPA: outer membrane beta-barrel protein [Flavobacteriales bacterium]|nr:outer membrane beta-barrel protein [Flavobacteriales bacterium]